jgi:tripartite-type tricarboxylate transporter receptor subunit TctC
MPGAGSLIATNYIANVAPKDGTYIGAVNGLTATDLLIYPERTKFDPRLLQWIGSALRENHVGVVRSDSAVKTFDDVFKQELIISGTGGATNAYPTLTNAVLGTKFKVVSGYPGGNDISLAMERGEVFGRCGWSWSSVLATQKPWYDDKKINVLAQLALNKHADLPNVPLILDLAKTPEQKQILTLVFARQALGRPYLAPPGVPQDRVDVLRKAFMDTMKDKEFLAEAEKGKLEITPISGENVQKIVADTYKVDPAVAKKTGEMLDVK